MTNYLPALEREWESNAAYQHEKISISGREEKKENEKQRLK